MELFFDLVFVFTITQLTSLLVHDPDLLHLLRVAVLLAIIFWMYGGYAWLTNAVAADTAARRWVETERTSRRAGISSARGTGESLGA